VTYYVENEHCAWHILSVLLDTDIRLIAVNVSRTLQKGWHGLDWFLQDLLMKDKHINCNQRVEWLNWAARHNCHQM